MPEVKRQTRFEDNRKLEKEFDNIITHLNRMNEIISKLRTLSFGEKTASSTRTFPFNYDDVNRKSLDLGPVLSSQVIDTITIVVFSCFTSGMTLKVADGADVEIVPASSLSTPGHTETRVLKKVMKGITLSGIFAGTFPCEAGEGAVIIKFLDMAQ